MSESNTFKITLQEVVGSLYNAAKLGDLVTSRVLTAAVDQVPTGIDIAKLGQEAITHLESLPQNHPLREGLDLGKMNKGLGYLRDGTVIISHYDAKGISAGDPVEIDYKR